MSQTFDAPRLKTLCWGMLAAAATWTSAIFLSLALTTDVKLSELPWLMLHFFGALWVCLIAGTPAFALFKRMGIARWWSAAIAGGALGAAYAWSLNQEVGVMVLNAGAGMASALAFWFTLTKLAGEVRAT